MGSAVRIEDRIQELAEAVSPGHGSLLVATYGVAVLSQAAARIAALEADLAAAREEVERLREADQHGVYLACTEGKHPREVNIGKRGPCRACLLEEAEARAEAADALRDYFAQGLVDYCDPNEQVTKDARAHLNPTEEATDAD